MNSKERRESLRYALKLLLWAWTIIPLAMAGFIGYWALIEWIFNKFHK